MHRPVVRTGAREGAATKVGGTLRRDMADIGRFGRVVRSGRGESCRGTTGVGGAAIGEDSRAPEFLRDKLGPRVNMRRIGTFLPGLAWHVWR